MTSPVAGITALEVLGHGGFSVVYRGRQESVGREVALKVDNRMVRDDRDRRRFLREAHAAGQLSDHPNVISVFDAGITDDGRPYLVMELCTAGSLADRLKKDGPLPAPDVREVGVRIADALETAHQAGVLHRDLKPANILVNRFGSPGLADFGLAASHDASRQLSATLEALTPAYAAPEVFRMERPTVAVDVYGLGATLYSLLSGRPPRWPAEGYPSIATIISLQSEPVPDLPGVPGALVAVLRKAMANEPTDRYPSAAAFRDALSGVALDAPTGMFTAIPADTPSSGGPSGSTAGAVAGGAAAGAAGLVGSGSGAPVSGGPSGGGWGSPGSAGASGSNGVSSATGSYPVPGSLAAAGSNAAGGPNAGSNSVAGPDSVAGQNSLAGSNAATRIAGAPAAQNAAAVPVSPAGPPSIRGSASVPTRPVPAQPPAGQAQGRPGQAQGRPGSAPTTVAPAVGGATRPPGAGGGHARPAGSGGTGTVTAPPKRKRKWPLVAFLLVIAMFLGVGAVASGAAEALYDQLRDNNSSSDNTPFDQNNQPADNNPVEQEVGGDDPTPSPETEPSKEPRKPTPTASPAPDYQGADPNVITSVGLGPFRVDQPVAPLLDSRVARRPSGGGSCSSDSQLVTRSGKYSEVTASQDGELISHVIIRNGNFATRSGLAVGSSEDKVRKNPEAQESTNADSETKAFVVRDGGNSLLFIVNEGKVTMIVVGRSSAINSIVERIPSGVC